MPQEKKSHRFMHSYLLHPDIHFATQFPGENIILVLRAHPITQIPWVFNAVIAIFVIFFINFFLPQFLSVKEIIFFNLFFVSLIFSYLFLNFFIWFFNVGIVTDKRIIDVDISSIIYKEVSEAWLSKVEDTTAKSGGFFSAFFNYGNVFIQTAGTEINIEFVNAPDPNEVVKTINNLLK